MPRLGVYSFSISVDGYGAGPGQNLDNPLGVGGMALHEWAFATRTFRQMHKKEGGNLRVCRRYIFRPGLTRLCSTTAGSLRI